jgi:hypothetical protein
VPGRNYESLELDVADFVFVHQESGESDLVCRMFVDVQFVIESVWIKRIGPSPLGVVFNLVAAHGELACLNQYHVLIDGTARC